MKKTPDPEEVKDKIKRMKALFALQKAHFIDLYFGDESGFSLSPQVPYGWQPVGEQVAIGVQRTHVTNILGFLNPITQTLFPYATAKNQNVDSDFVIQCIDDFVSRCKKPTVIVLDNATFHTSEKFREKRKAWERQDLFVFYLPKYSPHLNLIETLWRKMKYEWIRPKDYRSKTAK